MTNPLASTPAYTVNADYESYAEGWTTTDAGLLTRQLARAEGYIDLLGAAWPIVYPATDTLHSLVINGDPTGGNITLGLSVGGTSYVTGAILWNATASAVANAFNSIPSFPGGVSAVGGPLPYQPIFVSYQGALGRRYIPPGSVATANLTGDANAAATFTLSGRGGAVDKRFNLSNLQASDIQALKRAVCAQTQYMQQMDPNLFTTAQYSEIKGPDFTTKGRMPVVAPLAKREFALAGITVGTARSRP